MSTFIVAAGDELWAPVFQLHKELSAGVVRKDNSPALVPDNEMTVKFVVKSVGEAGKAIQGWPGKVRTALVVDLEEGHPIHTAALQFAADNGGQANIGRAAIKLLGVTLRNKPVEEAVAE